MEERTNRVALCDNAFADWDELNPQEIKWLRIAAWRFANDVLAENSFAPPGYPDDEGFKEAREGMGALQVIAEQMGITQEEKGEWTR